MPSHTPQFDVTIAGEINMDLIFYGLPEDLPIERELLASGFRITLGSSSAILAHNLSLLGARVGFITLYGEDAMGRSALERLGESGVDLTRSIAAAGPTSTGVTALLHHGSRRHILTYPGLMFEMSRAHLDLDYLANARHFHLSSLFLQRALQPEVPRLLRELRSRGLTLSLDTNDDPEDRWDGVLDEVLDLIDLFLPNEDEIRRIARSDSLDESLAALGRRVPLIAVKCGRRGAVVQCGDERTAVPGLDVSPVDTIGAGDSFNAGFLAAYLRGASPIVCAQAGNVAGALSTLRVGGTEAFRDADLRVDFLRHHWPAITP